MGFKTFSEPQFGTCSAEQNGDGSWAVTLKGNMQGYVDDYQTDFEQYKFDVTATVSKTGEVSNIDVEKVE